MGGFIDLTSVWRVRGDRSRDTSHGICSVFLVADEAKAL